MINKYPGKPTGTKQYKFGTGVSQDGNRRSGVTLAQTPWFIYLRAKRLKTGRWAPTRMCLQGMALFNFL